MFLFQKDQARPKDIYLASPNNQIIGLLDGVTSARLVPRFNDIWELNVVVDRYVDEVPSKQYDHILQYMELHIPEIGWFRINQLPKETFESNGRVYKTFTAQGYECVLQDADVTSFYANTGDELSYEFFPENTITIDRGEIPIRNLQLYVTDASDDPADDNYYGYGILNLLEHYYFKKWKIGEVDLALQSLRGRVISIDSQNLYAALTQDIAKAFHCVFEFDRENFIVNVREFKNIGKSIGIQMSFRNLVNSLNIDSYSDPSYTQFRVTGGNDSTVISYVNFGSHEITNLSYYMRPPYVNPVTVDKYHQYTEYRESQREAYANLSKEDNAILAEISEIKNRVPMDAVKTSWAAYSLEELREELANFQIMLQALINLGQNVEGQKQYQTYLCIKDEIIPDIKAQITAKKNNTSADTGKWELNWALFGIEELNTKRKGYHALVNDLTNKGYHVPWKPGSENISKATHNLHYQDYLNYKQYVEQIDAKLVVLNAQVERLNARRKRIEPGLKKIKDSVSITNPDFGFTEAELYKMEVLTVNTDYSDSSIAVQDYGDIDELVEYAWDLYKSAKDELEYRSQPQLNISCEAENLFRLKEFKKPADKLEIGDFLFIDYGIPGYQVLSKQRIVEYTLELVDMSDTSFSLGFSNVSVAYGKADDYRFFFEGNSGSVSKNTITGSSAKAVTSIAADVAMSVLQGYLRGGNALFPNGLSDADTQKLLDALSGLIDGNLSVNELKATLAKIDTLEANNAFIKYLEASLLVADKGYFKKLAAETASINNLLAGTLGVEDGLVINLTAKNAKIEDAYIKELITSRITVADLLSHTVSSNIIKLISSKTGDPAIAFKDATQQFYDASGKIRIQMGQDAKGHFNFIVRGADGTTALFNENGVTSHAIADGLIVNDMIKSSTLSKDRLNFPIVEANAYGGVNITQIHDGSGGLWGVEMTKFKKSALETMSGLSSSVNAVSKSITNKVWQTDIDRASGILSKKISVVEQTAQGIKSTVSDVSKDLSTAKSSITQLSDSIALILDDGSDVTGITLTNGMIDVMSKKLTIMSSDGKHVVIEDGQLSSDAIKSINYDYSSGIFSKSGTLIDLSTGLIRSKNFAIDSTGNSYFNGKINADSGSVGGWIIDDNGIHSGGDSKSIDISHDKLTFSCSKTLSIQDTQKDDGSVSSKIENDDGTVTVIIESGIEGSSTQIPVWVGVGAGDPLYEGDLSYDKGYTKLTIDNSGKFSAVSRSDSRDITRTVNISDGFVRLYNYSSKKTSGALVSSTSGFTTYSKEIKSGDRSETKIQYNLISTDGEIRTKSANSYRHINGNYASFWRNDGKGLYLMLTNADNQYGSFNTFRPLSVNLSTGVCNINGVASGCLPLTGGTLNGSITFNNYTNGLVFPISTGKIQVTTQSNGGAFVIAYIASGSTSWTTTPLNINTSGICRVNGCLPLTGGTMTGNLSMGTKWVSFNAGHIASNTSQALYFAASNESAYEVFLGVRNSMWTLCPAYNNNVNLGTGSYRWNQLFAATSTISTSDRNEKNSIETLDTDLWKKFIMGLNTVSYKLNEGTSGRTHHGLVAQDVEALLKDIGVNPDHFAGFIKFEKTKPVKKTTQHTNQDGIIEETEVEESEAIFDENGNPEYGYGLRYEEFISSMICVIQSQQKDIEQLKETVKAFEGH